MRNFTILKAALLSAFFFFLFSVGTLTNLFGQITLPFQSDFSGVGGSSQSSTASMPQINDQEHMPNGFLYAGSERIYEAGQKLKFGIASAVGVLPTDVINAGTASSIEVKFNAIGWPATGANPATQCTIVLTYGDQTDEVSAPVATGWPIENADLIEFSCQFTAISTPTSLIFKTLPDAGTANGSRIFLDNVRIIDASNPTQVSKPTFSPGTGTYTTSQNVTINCNTAGATIHYTTDGSTPTTASNVFSTPILVETTTTIKAMAVKTGLEPSEVATATYTFPQGISTLAELRTLAPPYNNGANNGTTLYTYTGQAVVTQKKISTATNQAVTMYIQDETAAIMVYDATKKLQADVEIGDKITNIQGTLTNYYGMVEIIPTGECNHVSYMINQVKTTDITAKDLDDKHDNPLQAKVITLKDVLYVQTGVFEKDTYYDLKENDIVYEGVVCVESLFDTDYIGKQIPTALVRIDGVCNFKRENNRIVPLDNSNHIILSITNPNKAAIQLSPNPANSFVNIVTGSPMKLEVYGLLGNLIAVENLYEGTNTISVSEYPAGMYLMKLVDVKTGQAYVQKLVVQ